jgi:dihydroorotate dehydrogenase
MNKVILSPPFSNLALTNLYPNTTRIIGTYTLNKRRGLWRVLTTLKKTNRGWVNNVGLRNGGIMTVPNKPFIVSIAELESGDWLQMLNHLSTLDNILGVELNISCPNAQVKGVGEDLLRKFNETFNSVIVKVPHDYPEHHLFSLIECGAKVIHISNTKKTEVGSLSGVELIQKNLQTIKTVKKHYPHVKVVGGGGIYNLESAKQYIEAGADYISLSTSLLGPFRTYFLIKGLHTFLAD